MPITVPAENATFRPSLRPCLAAAAVRQLARVATDIPMNPERPEKKPPVMKANGTNTEMRCRPKDSSARTANTATNTMPTTEYCCFR